MNKHTQTDPLAELAALRQRLDKLETEHSDFQRNASRRPFVPRKFLLSALAVVLVFAGGLLGEENMPLVIDPTGNVRIGTLTCANIVQEGWRPVVFENGWHNINPNIIGVNGAGYFKDSMGIVHLKGFVTGGGNTTIFRVPAHYKPDAREVFGCFTDDKDGKVNFGRVDVSTTGEVMVMAGPNPGSVCLDGLTFRAGSN